MKQAGYRIRRGWKEALYRTVARELALHYEPRSGANRRAVTNLVSAMLRLGIRDFGRAFQRGDIVVSGPHREIWAARKAGRVNSLIQGFCVLYQGLTRAVGSTGSP